VLGPLLDTARPLLAPAFTAWGSPVTVLEIVAFVLALAMVAANMRVNPVAWPLAIASSLLDVTIDGARGILFNVTGGPDLALHDVNQAAEIIRRTADPDANIIFGAVIDENMKDKIRITVIATGFDTANQQRPALLRSVAVAAAAVPQPKVVHRPAPQDFPARVRNPEDLDIPAFLRRHAG
jgi:cell division protein FtsZ